jgi:hypothetical protein
MIPNKEELSMSATLKEPKLKTAVQLKEIAADRP